MNTANELSQPESEMESCPPPLSSVISTHSTVKGTPQRIREWLMSLPEDSPASRSALQESAKEPQTSATAGQQQSNACAWFDRSGRCWRTFQGSLLADTLEQFSETWPRAGLIADGEFYPLPKWERRISEIGSGLWPTPVAHDDNKSPEAHLAMKQRMGGNRTAITSLQVMVKALERQMWPTPTKSDGTEGPGNSGRDGGDNLRTAVAKALPTPSARDWRSGTGRQENGHSPQLPEVIGGQLNPTWVEWLMGWPLGWTDLQPLAMDKFRQWCEQHGC